MNKTLAEALRGVLAMYGLPDVTDEGLQDFDDLLWDYVQALLGLAALSEEEHDYQDEGVWGMFGS